MSNRRRPRRDHRNRHDPQRSDVYSVPPGTDVRDVVRHVAEHLAPRTRMGMLSPEALIVVCTAQLCSESPTWSTTWGEIEDMVARVSELVRDSARDLVRVGRGDGDGYEAVLLAASRASGSGGLS